MPEERCAHPIVMVCWQTHKVFPAPGKPFAADPHLKIINQSGAHAAKSLHWLLFGRGVLTNRREEQTWVFILWRGNPRPRNC